jgi:bacterial/archaeal transporter family-2 protein
VAAALLVVTAALGRGGDGMIGVLRQPPWLWLGGFMGAIVVTAITYSPPRIGAFATIALLIAGQLAMGVVIDAVGLFGAERIPLSAARLAGLALLAGGAALVLKR